MKVFKFVILLFFVFTGSLSAFAAEKPSERWDSLIDISYKFTWYPQRDLQDLLEKKSSEYQQTLEEYQNLLTAELTGGSTPKGLINPELFVSAKSWKLYYRLAISKFCSFLAYNEEVHLENAIIVLSVISAKRDLVNVSFWHYLFQAYGDLINKDRESFVKSVFQLWQDVILQIKVEDLIADSSIYESDIVRDLPYLYENVAHLIITKAIIEQQMPNLSSLAVVVMALQDELTTDNGYKDFVKAIGERLQGIKSDNYNLNFAIAFVEATANQYAFEDEKSAELIVDKYNTTCIYYEAALSLADTNKGKAAILTQYMGFNNYIIRRLIDNDSLLINNAVFLHVPGVANRFVDKSIGLYDALAETSVRETEFSKRGFHKRSNYIEAMHQLWDSSAKLLMTLSQYYKMIQPPDETGQTSIAEIPLLKYLAFFDRYGRVDSEIVPNNAFFLAAYAAGQLSDLYATAAKYSTSIDTNNLAFTYQLQAVEVFPLDIVGVLKLAYQTKQEGRQRLYFQHVVPLASRLRESTVARSWLDKNPTEYENNIIITSNVIPDIVDNAFLYINVLQQAEGSQTEEGMYRRLIIMSKVHTALKAKNQEQEVPHVLASVAKQDVSGNKSPSSNIAQDNLPPALRKIFKSIPETEKEYNINRLKNSLYASHDSKVHSFLRELYFENPNRTHHYLLLLQGR